MGVRCGPDSFDKPIGDVFYARDGRTSCNGLRSFTQRLRGLLRRSYSALRNHPATLLTELAYQRPIRRRVIRA